LGDRVQGIANTAILAVLVPTCTLAIALAFSFSCCARASAVAPPSISSRFCRTPGPSIVFGVGALLLALFVLQRALPIYGTQLLSLLVVFVIAASATRTRMTNSGPHPDSCRA